MRSVGYKRNANFGQVWKQQLPGLGFSLPRWILTGMDTDD